MFSFSLPTQVSFPVSPRIREKKTIESSNVARRGLRPAFQHTSILHVHSAPQSPPTLLSKPKLGTLCVPNSVNSSVSSKSWASSKEACDPTPQVSIRVSFSATYGRVSSSIRFGCHLDESFQPRPVDASTLCPPERSPSSPLDIESPVDSVSTPLSLSLSQTTGTYSPQAYYTLRVADAEVARRRRRRASLRSRGRARPSAACSRPRARGGAKSRVPESNSLRSLGRRPRSPGACWPTL